MEFRGFKVEAEKLIEFNKALSVIDFYADRIAQGTVFKSIVNNGCFIDTEYNLIIELKKNTLEISVKDKKTVIKDFFGK